MNAEIESKILPEYSWFSTGEERDDATPLLFLQCSKEAAENDVPFPVPPSWTALALTDHLILERTGNSADSASSTGIERTIIDPICMGAAGSIGSSVPARSVRLSKLFDRLGVRDFRQLAATRRVVLGNLSVLDTLGNEWDAVMSGAVHTEEFDSFVQTTSLGAVDDADNAISHLLSALVEVQLFRVGGMLSMIRMLRAVRAARVVCNMMADGLGMVQVDMHGAMRLKRSGDATTWTLREGLERAQNAWMQALKTVTALRANSGADFGSLEGSTACEGRSNAVLGESPQNDEDAIADLVCVSDERERDAVDLSLVLGWVVQTGFWSPVCIRSSLLLDSVYEAGTPITSPGALRVLGPYAILVNRWVSHGTLELGEKLTVGIDDVGPLPMDAFPGWGPHSGSISDISAVSVKVWCKGAFDHESGGVLNAPRLARATRVGRIRVSPGRGMDLPGGNSAVLRGVGGRARVTVVGGALVSTPQWRQERLKMRVELSLRAGVPGGAVVAEMEVGRGDMQRLEEYTVNGMLEGAFGKDAAFWLLAQIRAGKLAVHPDSDVSYLRKSTVRRKADSPLVDARISPECVQLLHSYTDGERIFVDFENNGALKAVSVGSDGSLSVERKRSRYEARRLSECSIVSRRGMR